MPACAKLLKRDIEAKLARRVPAALSPLAHAPIRPYATGYGLLDSLLDGGFPLGTLCEVTGPECSGRTAITMALLAAASHEAACAYIDVGDTCSPCSAAAAGVALRNLLWVRVAADAQQHQHNPAPVHGVQHGYPHSRSAGQQHSRGVHPRDEVKGLSPALEQMLFYKDERRKRKLEGTPGYPNQPLSLLEATADQVAWEQFNSRKVDERDPLRQLDKAAAQAARERASIRADALSKQGQELSPWRLIDRALRATDQVLQAGGFHTVVLDVASLSAEQTTRIPSHSWWRFQKAARQGDCILLVLSQSPCTGSSADCVVECSADKSPDFHGVLSSAHHTARILRQRTAMAPQRKGPGRVTSLHSTPAWMHAVGR